MVIESKLEIKLILEAIMGRIYNLYYISLDHLISNQTGDYVPFLLLF